MKKLLLILPVNLLACQLAHATTLTKIQAFEELQANGFKWNLTKTLVPEAESKLLEAESELRPRFQLGFRQYAARINPVQFGGENVTSLDTVGFGTSAVEMKWSIVDSMSKIKVLGSKVGVEMNAAQARHFQNELTALMLIDFTNLQRLQGQLQALDANIEKDKLIVKLVEVKKRIGAGIALEIARAKNLLQLDQLKKMAVQAKITKAKFELASVLGRENLTEELPSIQARVMARPAGVQTVAQALKSRSDLLTAERAAGAALEAQELSKSWIFPKLDLFAEVGSTQASLLGVPAKTLNGFVGFAFSVPLETGGLLTAKRQEATLQVKKAELQVQEIRAEITTQMNEAIEQLEAAEEALKASKDYLKTAEEEALLAERRYAEGSSSIVDLTNGRTNMATARDLNLEQSFNYEAAKIAYFRALGDFSEYFKMEKE